jgi:ArsR family transcriptional regulator
MSDEMTPILDRLRAAGEATRLRILALLKIRDLAVGELVQVLDQSQPRLSHHLKTLTAAGLVERLPEGSWVFYRAATSGPAGVFLTSLFDQIDLTDRWFAEDASRLQHVSDDRAASAEAYFSDVAETWDTVRGLHSPSDAIEVELMDMAGPGPFQRMIDFGTGTGRMLNLFAPLSSEAEGIDMSHQMLTVARANLERAGVESARVRQGNVMATPFDDASADLITIHQVLHYMDTPGRAVKEAARVLKPGGRALIVDFAPHDLEFLRAEHGHHRLGVNHDALEGWARAAGLHLSQPREIAPPKGAKPGLTVHIWAAEKRAAPKEAAA